MRVPILLTFNLEKPIIIKTDILDYILEVVLS